MTHLFSRFYVFLLLLLFLLFFLSAGSVAFSQPTAQNVSAATDSVKWLSEALTAQPKNNTLRLRLAELYLRRDMLDEAEEEFKTLAESDSFAVRAFTGLGKVYFYKTPSRIIPLERLKELLKIDFRSKAIDCFKQALERDADYLPARYFLARSYQKKDDQASLEAAEQEFNFILSRVPDYRDLIYQLGYTFQKMKNYQRALDYFNRISASQPDYARANIRLSEVHYELGDQKLSTTCYFAGMKNLADEEMLDYLFDEQKLLLTAEEKNELEAAAYPQKGVLFVRYWKSRDPDPSTPENERLMEHFRRLHFAREFFHFTAPPYYDDRGKIYIKYGEPDARYYSVAANIPVKENESWSYESIEEGLVFDFVAEGAYYRQVPDLTEAALSGYSYDQKVALASTLYFERSHLSRTYARLSAGFTRDRLQNLHAVRARALDKFPGEIYQPANARQFRFPFITKWGQFKADSNKTRVEFYTSFPGMALRLDPSAAAATKHVDFFIEINNANFDSIFSTQRRMTYQITNAGSLPANQFIFQNNCRLAPGQYSAAFVIHDVETANKGVQRKDLEVLDFSSGRLALSSLQLAENIEPASEQSKEVFVKNGLAVSPYTFSRVMRTKPIFLYFEIYNLSLNTDGNTQYEVNYTVETIAPQRNLWQKTIGGLGRLIAGSQKNIISTTTSRMGETRDTFEYIAFDLKNLEKGKTVLKVQIRDRCSQESVTSEIEMLLID